MIKSATSGGCQDGAFGFGTNVEDTATFGAQGQVDVDDTYRWVMGCP